MLAGRSAAKPGSMARTAVHCDGNGQGSQPGSGTGDSHFVLGCRTLERSCILRGSRPALRRRRPYGKSGWENLPTDTDHRYNTEQPAPPGARRHCKVAKTGTPKVADESLSGTEISQFTDRQQITDFSREPYRVLKAIPVTVRSLDIEDDIEAVFEEGNIAWVAASRVDAINGLKAEILNTLEDCEANKGRLGSEPARQLAILRTCLERIPQRR